jgi:hypothetical protein
VNPEDRLHSELHRELGDPDLIGSRSDDAVSVEAGWAAVQERKVARDVHRRRVLAGVSALGAILVLGIGALLTTLSGPASVTTAAGTTSSSASGSTAGASTTTTGHPHGSTPGAPTTSTSTPDTATTIPASTTGSTGTTGTTTTGNPYDCGTAYLASGWPTTMAQSPVMQQCILDHFASGQPAVYAERAQTDGEGGHIEITTYDVIGVHRVRRTVDARGAQPPGGITVSVCTGLSGNLGGPITASGCSPA